MPPQKRKNSPLTGSQTAAFILLWCATYAIGFAGLWLTLEYFIANSYSSSIVMQIFRYWDITTLFLAFGLVVPGLLQTQMIRRFLRGSSRGWLSLTMVGLIISWLIIHLNRILILGPQGEETNKFEFLIPVLFIPVALTQTIWLAQYVKRAWLWPLASLLSTGVYLFMFNKKIELSSLVPCGLVYGLIMGFTLFYLHIDALWSSPGIDQGEAEYG